MCSTLGCAPGRLRCKNSKCVHMSVVCDGYDHCGDGSDEELQICNIVSKCPPDQFRCTNGRCIDSHLKCDGQTDCLDNSDEVDCETSVCKWNSCSHHCVELKTGNFTCKCESGFTLTNNGNCKALGLPAQLVVAAEAELRLMSPYKAGAINQLNKAVLATAPGYKVDAVDVVYDSKQVIAYWSDHQNKRIQSMSLHISTGGRITREAEIRTVLSGLHDPRGISIDWDTKKIYITDSDRIVVSTIDGQQIYTLINKDLHQPREIVVAPAEGLVFWADWGPPHIESAYMDGAKRKILVSSGIFWPTGLAIDHPTRRLYWADPKALVIESILFDGSSRKLIRRFDKGIYIINNYNYLHSFNCR